MLDADARFSIVEHLTVWKPGTGAYWEGESKMTNPVDFDRLIRLADEAEEICLFTTDPPGLG